MKLLHKLASRQIYATSTVRTNWIGLPISFKNGAAFKNAPQGISEWRMHQFHWMASIVWKDKKPILLLSTHAIPLVFLACWCLRSLGGTAWCMLISWLLLCTLNTPHICVEWTSQINCGILQYAKPYPQVLAHDFIFSIEYENRKYVHHLLGWVQKEVQEASKSFTVHGRIMWGTFAAIESWGKPGTSSV